MNKFLSNDVKGKSDVSKSTPEKVVKKGKAGLKIMIQVDFEGIASVVNFDEIYPGHAHFERNCKILTNEVNAAIEGASAAGATEFIVRDGHAGNINVDPLLLDKRAMLTRGRVPGTPHTMVLGIDSTFDALLFIGAHARAGEQIGTLSHTMSLDVLDFRINDRPLFEPAFNALYAGQFGVPVVFVAGDDAACREAVLNFGNIETVTTKYAFGRTCAMSKSPEFVCDEIRAGVKNAILNIDKGTVFSLEKPYRMEVKVKVKGSETGEEIVDTCTSDNLEIIMKRFWEHL